MIPHKPCPFCGGEYLLVSHLGHMDPPFCAECCGCLARGPFAETEDGAVEKWNERRQIAQWKLDRIKEAERRGKE